MKKLILALSLVLFLSGCNVFENDYETQLNPGHDVLELNDPFIDAGCVLTLNEERYQLEAQNIISTDEVGNFVLTYSKEIDNKKYICVRIVEVLDTTKPTATLNPGIDTIHLNEDHIDAGIETFDNYSTVSMVSVIDSVDNTSVGTYIIVYTFEDESNNTNLITRVVTVIE